LIRPFNLDGDKKNIGPSGNQTEGDDVRAAPPAQQQAGGDMAEIRPFRVEVHDAAIDDLRERLARTRWPEKEPVGDWSMGIPLAYVQELAGYWGKSYDMQRVRGLDRASAAIRRGGQAYEGVERTPLIHSRRDARRQSLDNPTAPTMIWWGAARQP
jgi:hypothetical protein